MMSGKRLVIAAVLLAAVQIGFLSWIIAGRAAILRDGQEVLLKVEPIDPRDFLRGDYVRLGYEIRNVPVKLIENAPAGEFVTEDGPIFVRLKKDEDGFWRARSASFAKPSGRGSGSRRRRYPRHCRRRLDARARRFGQRRLRHRPLLRAGRRGAGDRAGSEGAALRHPGGRRRRRHAADQGADGRRQEAL